MSHVRITRKVLDRIHDDDPLKPMLSHVDLTEADRNLIASALCLYEDEGQCDCEAQAQRAMELVSLLQHVNEWE